MDNCLYESNHLEIICLCFLHLIDDASWDEHYKDVHVQHLHMIIDDNITLHHNVIWDAPHEWISETIVSEHRSCTIGLVPNSHLTYPFMRGIPHKIMMQCGVHI